MNSEEQTLIDGLFTRLQQAETGSAPRDAQALHDGRPQVFFGMVDGQLEFGDS